jgi:hypothetical protein
VGADSGQGFGIFSRSFSGTLSGAKNADTPMGESIWGAILAPFWPYFGSILASLGFILAPSWPLLASSWPHFGPILALLASLGAHLGPILAHLGTMLVHLGCTWPHLGPSWLHLGPILAPSGLSWPLLASLGAHLAPSFLATDGSVCAPCWPSRAPSLDLAFGLFFLMSYFVFSDHFQME